jgi:flagellar motor switch protein FliM
MSEAPLTPEDLASMLEEFTDPAPEVSSSPEPTLTPEISFGSEPESSDGEVQSFVFGQESRRPSERLTGLERMGEKIARAMRPALEPIARMRLGVNGEPLEIRSFQEWQDEQPDFSSLTLYRLRPLKGGMLIQIHADFIASLVEIFYGGAPGPKRGRKPGDFTASEELLLNRVLDKISIILAEHWNEVTPVELAFGTRETNAVHMPFLRGDETVVVQRFAIAAGNASTMISILYPLAMLRPIEEKLEARAHDEDAAASQDWRWRLGKALEDVSLPVRSVLARPEISVAELLALKPGDIIPISLPPRTPLLAGTRRIADGVIGEQDGRAALMIEKIGNA